MDILFVTLSSSQANNSAMIRNNAMIEGLCLNEHSVDLLVLENLEREENFEWHKNVNLVQINGNGIYSKYRTKNKGNNRMKKIIRQLYFKFSIFDNTVTHVLKFNEDIINDNLKKEYDLIISSSDPKTAHIYTEKVINCGIKYKKWIQYWGDPLALDITNKSVYPRKLLMKFEKKILEKADGIVYVSPFTYKSQVELFPELKMRMSFLPIPYNKEETYNFPHKDEIIKIGYFGDYFSKYRNITPLLNAVENDKEYHLEIAGATDLKIEKKDNIVVNERLSLNLLKKRETETDIFVCILNKKGSQIPGKIYKYASTNKPILILLDGENKSEMNKYLSSFHRFIICENNEEDIKKVLSNITAYELRKYIPLTEISSGKIARKLLEFSEEL